MGRFFTFVNATKRTESTASVNSNAIVAIGDEGAIVYRPIKF
jgi:hypothetical protein